MLASGAALSISLIHMEPKHLIRAAIVVSVTAHLALVTGFMLADARPFEPPAPDAVSVDIVPAEAAPPVQETPPQPEPPKPPDPFRLPDLSITEKQQQQPSPQAAAEKAVAPPPQPAPPQQPPPQPPARQAAVQPQPSPQQPPSPPPQTPPQQQEVPAAPEPDITVKYGVMLGLPSSDGVGSIAYEPADIAPVDTEAFRRHLKSCSTLPGSVKSTDKVRIVLRAYLTKDGRLAGPPMLLEASASTKGPALMQAAISALQTCQPYAMLPADKYKEWKVLDLAFTPQDFVGG
jgi:outer membrane biosynthesis protein TonB